MPYYLNVIIHKMNMVNIVLLALVGALLSVNNIADAKCDAKDLKGAWAFTQWGTVGSSKQLYSSVGWLGQTSNGTGGWLTSVTGWGTSETWQFTANATVVPPCNVVVTLVGKTDPSKVQVYQGALSLDKKEFASYSNGTDRYLIGHFSRIDEPCKVNTLNGYYVGAGTRWVQAPNANETATTVYSQSLDCDSKGKCSVWWTGNPAPTELQQLRTTATVDNTINSTTPCKVSFSSTYAGHIGVAHHEGLFVIIDQQNSQGTIDLSPGQKP
jgi:hypothetical protein